MNNQMSRREAPEGTPKASTSPLSGEGTPKALTSPLCGEARIKSRPFLSAREGAPKA